MMNILKVCPLWQRRVEDQGSPMALLDSREFGLALGRVLVYGDREIAAHRIGVHDGHHIHRAAFPPQFHSLSEGSGIDLLWAKQLPAEADDDSVPFIQSGERPVISNNVDHFGVNSSLHSAGLVSVPLKVVVGFAAGNQNGEFTRMRVECSTSDGGVMKIQQRLTDARIVGGECERSRQGASLAAKTSRSF
jgi:hypothetical protein